MIVHVCPKKKKNLALQLAFNFTTVPLFGCNCHKSSNRFSPFDSYSFENSNEVFDLKSNYAEIKGLWAKDTLHLENTKIRNIDFVAFHYDSGYDFLILMDYLNNLVNLKV